MITKQHLRYKIMERKKSGLIFSRNFFRNCIHWLFLIIWCLYFFLNIYFQSSYGLKMTDFSGETWVDDDNKATFAVQNNGTEKIRTNFLPDFFRNFIFYWLFLIIWSFYIFLKYLFLKQLWSFKWRTFFGETWVDDNKATVAIQINGIGLNHSKSQIKLNLLIMEYNFFLCVCP